MPKNGLLLALVLSLLSACDSSTPVPAEVTATQATPSTSETAKAPVDRKALAERYAHLGGRVLMYGKPHPPIYAAARERLTKLMGAAPPDSRILAIGDGAKTDLAGAGRAGLDCLFIIAGVHAGDLLTPDGAIDAAGLAHLVKDAGARPVALARRLFW